MAVKKRVPVGRIAMKRLGAGERLTTDEFAEEIGSSQLSVATTLRRLWTANPTEIMRDRPTSKSPYTYWMLKDHSDSAPRRPRRKPKPTLPPLEAMEVVWQEDDRMMLRNGAGTLWLAKKIDG